MLLILIKLKDNISILTINREIQWNHWNFALSCLQAWVVLVEILSSGLLKVLKINISNSFFSSALYYKQKFM